MVRPTGTESAELVTLIHTKTKRGTGIPGDPSRYVDQYWRMDGTEMVAEYDPYIDDAAQVEQRELTEKLEGA